MPTFFFLLVRSLCTVRRYVKALWRSLSLYFRRRVLNWLSCSYSNVKGQWLIRVFADAEGGISLEDCRRLSRDIGQAFDIEDLITTSYVLEVSSPGLDRPLRTARDFQRQRQRMVTVFLNSPLMGQAQQTGRVAASNCIPSGPAPASRYTTHHSASPD